MSGGHFDYKCFQISQFAEELQHEIDTNSEEEIGHQYTEETLVVLRQCKALIEKAGKVAREIEWLYSGDHSEESFLRIVSPKLKVSSDNGN
jgi:hypothetical protein